MQNARHVEQLPSDRVRERVAQTHTIYMLAVADSKARDQLRATLRLVPLEDKLSGAELTIDLEAGRKSNMVTWPVPEQQWLLVGGLW